MPSALRTSNAPRRRWMGSWTWPDRSSAASWRNSKSPHVCDPRGGTGAGHDGLQGCYEL